MQQSSGVYRQQGNEFFTRLKEQPNAAPVIRKGRFNDARRCYNQAVEAAGNDEQRASAYKNLGVLYAYQLGSIFGDPMNKKDLEYHLRECISSYGRAYEFGKRSKSEDWLDYTHHQIQEFASDRYAGFLMMPVEERLEVLQFTVRCFERTALQRLESVAHIYYLLGHLTFEKAVSRFKEEPNLIYECRPYLDRALYWSKNSSLFRKDEMKELQSSIWLHQCMHESALNRRVGMRILEAHLNNDEELNMDTVWIVIDKFRAAIILARENDIEGEAQAHHQTALVYQNIIKSTELAYTHHLRCVTLAQTLIPRNLTSFDWYQISSTFVQQYRLRKTKEEEKAEEEQKQQFRLELASDLTEMDEKAQKGAHVFLEYIYEKYPPRKENAKIGSLESNDLGKSVKKAITHYHPDAQAKYDDEKWTFLCGEITKILNVKYALLDN